MYWRVFFVCFFKATWLVIVIAIRSPHKTLNSDAAPVQAWRLNRHYFRHYVVKAFRKERRNYFLKKRVREKEKRSVQSERKKGANYLTASVWFRYCLATFFWDGCKISVYVCFREELAMRLDLTEARVQVKCSLLLSLKHQRAH